MKAILILLLILLARCEVSGEDDLANDIDNEIVGSIKKEVVYSVRTTHYVESVNTNTIHLEETNFIEYTNRVIEYYDKYSKLTDWWVTGEYSHYYVHSVADNLYWREQCHFRVSTNTNYTYNYEGGYQVSEVTNQYTNTYVYQAPVTKITNDIQFESVEHGFIEGIDTRKEKNVCLDQQ